MCVITGNLFRCKRHRKCSRASHLTRSDTQIEEDDKYAGLAGERLRLPGSIEREILTQIGRLDVARYAFG